LLALANFNSELIDIADDSIIVSHLLLIFAFDGR
jgi:hypothetical protein